MKEINRRDFIKKVAAGGAVLGLGNIVTSFAFPGLKESLALENKDVVSVVKIDKDNIDYALRKAIDLLGGMRSITSGKERIMLKPNLVSPAPTDVTKPSVIKALAQLMIESGKDVSIGEG